MNICFVNSCVLLAVVAIPSTVIWAMVVFWTVFAIGIATIFLSGDWQRTRGLDKLTLFGAAFYAAPVAAFGTEHFTLTPVIASIIPAWIPWHVFWAYLVGACFITAGFSLVSRIQWRLAASLLALTFVAFVVLMDLPGWLRNPRDRVGLALVLRELSFCAGPLALATSLSEQGRATHILRTIARFLIAVTVLFYSVEQFLHADHVPGVPLERITPTWIYGHTFWTYFAAVVYAVAGIPLLLGKKTRVTATWIGLAVLVVELFVYAPIGVVDRASLDLGFNYWADTLMYCGAVLLLASALPRKEEPSSAAIRSSDMAHSV